MEVAVGGKRFGGPPAFNQFPINRQVELLSAVVISRSGDRGQHVVFSSPIMIALPHRRPDLTLRRLHTNLRPLRPSHRRHFTPAPRLADEQQQPNPPPPSPSQPPPNRPPPPRRPANSSQLPILPLIAIFCLGSGSFYFLAKSREGVTHQTYTAGEKAPPKDQWPGRRRDTEQ